MATVKKATVETSKSKLNNPFVILAALLGICVGAFEMLSYFRGGMPADLNKPMFVCSATGNAFEHTLKVGEAIPVYSPFSGQNTGYPAEPCFWTASGQIKKDPTWVLLNEAIGKSGPTFCPDCGRLVVGHNPVPFEGSKPPPTKQEYEAMHHRAAAAIPGNGLE